MNASGDNANMAGQDVIVSMGTDTSNQTATSNLAPDRLSDERGATRARFRLGSVGLLLIACVCVIGVSRFIAPGLGSLNQIDTVITISVFSVLVAYGQGLVVLTGGLDLSVASVLALGGILGAALIDKGIPGTPALIIVLAICGGLGAISGVGVAIAKISPFIMTLAVGLILQGIILGVTKGTPGDSAPEILRWLMKARLPYVNMHVAVLALGAFVLFAWWLQQYSVLGRYWYAVGNSDRAAYLAGLPLIRARVLPYVLAAICYGFAGLCLTAYSNGSSLDMGNSYLLPSIAAVVVGGASILGGTGRALATIIAAIMLTFVGTTVQALNGGIAERTILNGMLILGALLLLGLRSRSKGGS